MKQSTLCLILDGKGKVLLGLKKRGFAKGKIDGFGGKLKEGETIEQAAVRELEEEAFVKASLDCLEKVGELAFEWPAKQEWNQLMHVFLVRDWVGEPRESEEMKPEWHSIERLPFHRMWKSDTEWFYKVLKQGKKVKGRFVFEGDNETVKEFELEEMNEKP